MIATFFFILVFVLCVPSPKGDQFSPMQDPSHASIKSHCILGLSSSFQQACLFHGEIRGPMMLLYVSRAVTLLFTLPLYTGPTGQHCYTF